MAADPIRQRILDAAAQVLSELGPTPRVVSAIAERAGISRPTMYKYVGDKQAVFEALLARELGSLIDEVVPMVEAIESPVEDFLDIAVYAQRWARHHAVVSVVIARHPAIVVQHIGDLIPIVTRIGLERLGPPVQAGIERGVIPPIDLERLLIWMCRVLGGFLLMPAGEETDEDVRASLLALLQLGAIAIANQRDGHG